MEKVYDNAEYANKVLSANALRKRIKKNILIAHTISTMLITEDYSQLRLL